MPDSAAGTLDAYYRPQETIAADLALIRRTDELHLEHPFAGSRMLRDMLKREGHRQHVATLMKKMGIEALYKKPNTSASTESTPVTKITKIVSYSEYGQGDVVIVAATNSSTCVNGYWLKKTDPGFNANLGMAIAAYLAKSGVVLAGITGEKWPGSSGYFCHLYNISYR